LYGKTQEFVAADQTFARCSAIPRRDAVPDRGMGYAVRPSLPEPIQAARRAMLSVLIRAVEHDADGGVQRGDGAAGAARRWDRRPVPEARAVAIDEARRSAQQRANARRLIETI
jgi:hypothetical protein